MLHRCENCQRMIDAKDYLIDLARVDKLSERIEPGGVVPSGECPGCASLVYPYVKPVRVIWGQCPQVMEVRHFESELEKKGFLDAIAEHDGWLACETQEQNEDGSFPPIAEATKANLMASGNYKIEELE